jgi:DNA repair protein RecO (recombination protein O)
VAGRGYKTEAVVLRSLRLGEADRVLHIYTLERGRIGAVAKGIRKTKSRFGARLEPLSHVELLLHQGGGELQTVTGVDLIRPHSATREDPYRLAVGLVGAEAMLRLFTEQEANPRAFGALTRFLDLLDEAPRKCSPGSRRAPAAPSAPAVRTARSPSRRRAWREWTRCCAARSPRPARQASPTGPPAKRWT